MRKRKIFIVLGIFFFSLVLRGWDINKMGRTWDEQFYVEQGYNFVELLKKGDIRNFYWVKDPDPPPFAKDIYGIFAHFDTVKISNDHQPVFRYDLTYSRFVSAIFGSLSVILIVLFGWEYFSSFIGITAGIVLSTIPTFLGLSQLVTIESPLMFFFTSSVYAFIKFLEKPSWKKSYFVGTLLGLSLLVKYTNTLLLPLFIGIFILRHFLVKQRKNIFFGKNIFFFLLGGLQTLIIWITPFFHLQYFFAREYGIRFAEKQSPWEWFFGFPVHVPWIYYFVQFLIRTPFALIVLALIGTKIIDIKRKWIYYVVFIWFLVPFLQSFYQFKMQGIRYIIEVYAPFSLIVALGFEFLVTKISPRLRVKIFSLVLLILYMLVLLWRITPYYLDYFNILVGGAKNVYEEHLFELGWWGQGGKEASLYLLSHASSHARIGYVLNPVAMMEFSPKFFYEPFQAGKKYDYIIVNYSADQKLFFDERQLLKLYAVVYTVSADGAPLVHIYKAK